MDATGEEAIDQRFVVDVVTVLPEDLAACAGAEVEGAAVVVGVPHERPPLSKDFLLGSTQDSAVVPTADWYAENDVDVLLNTHATALDVGSRTVTLSDGRRLSYDRLVLATGARSRRLRGIDGDRVCYLRTAADAELLRDRLAAAHDVAILGGGFIGCEVAAVAARLGKQVTILEALDVPLQRVLGAAIGSVLTEIHRSHGVDVRTHQVVDAVVDESDRLVVTTSGTTLGCDLLVVGAGSVPNVELAEQAGLDVNGGILVDEWCRTSAPSIYALGDVAAQLHPGHGRRVRVEHHDTALRQGACVARNLLGAQEQYADVHWFWSDQYDHAIQCAGIPDDSDQVIVRGSLEERSFCAFTVRANRIRSVIALDRPRDVMATRRLIGQPHAVTEQQLRDESLPLKHLVDAPRRRAAIGPRR